MIALISIYRAISRYIDYRDRPTPNTLSALANKAVKVIVSRLTVWWIGQASTGLIYFFKRAVSCDKTLFYSCVMTPFLILLL